MLARMILRKVKAITRMLIELPGVNVTQANANSKKVIKSSVATMS